MIARTAGLTVAAMLAFAGNSLLCREALATGAIDAGAFTAVRLASGALVLVLLAARRGPWQPTRALARGAGSWASAAALFAYAAPFSYAYLELGAGTGALILFGVVQATMIGWAIAGGQRPRPLVWLGLAAAIAGLVGLTLPGARAPDPAAAALMALAGIAWGVYSIRGRRTGADPLVATAGNFARSLPLVAALLAAALLAGDLHGSPRGYLLASASGALASGLGYSIWYAALPDLGATRAAIVQLVVPALAAAGGVALLGEPMTLRLALSGTAILGGVALALRARG